MSGRLRSDLVAAAWLRSHAAAGRMAVMLHRGAAEAGALYVLVDRLDGRATVYGPAPQSAYDADAGERLFARLHADDTLPLAEAEARLARERRFDPDAFVLAVESPAGEHGLALARD